MLLRRHQLAVAELLRADAERHRLVERVDAERAGAQLPLAPVGGALAFVRLAPRLRETGAVVVPPLRPDAGVRPRRLDVDQQHPTRLERVVEAAQGLLVLRARAAEAEDAARDDRAVAPRRVELVQ